jgi:tetratricopeptide (TPR) repeat protein
VATAGELERLQLLAALGPHWWMNGIAAEGAERIAALAAMDDDDDDDDEEDEDADAAEEEGEEKDGEEVQAKHTARGWREISFSAWQDEQQPGDATSAQEKAVFDIPFELRGWMPRAATAMAPSPAEGEGEPAPAPEPPNPANPPPAAAVVVAEPPQPFLGAGVGRGLLLGCCLDGGGMNAYASAGLERAAQLHAQALALADSALEEALRPHAPPPPAPPTAGACAVNSVSGEADARLLRSRALDGLGRVARVSGDYAASYRLHLLAAHAITRPAGPCGRRCTPHTFGASRLRPSPLWCVASAVSNAGVACFKAGRRDRAHALHSTAMTLRRPLGDQRGYACTLGNLALLTEGPAEALPLYRESLAIRRGLGDVWGIAGSLRAMAVEEMKLGTSAALGRARAHLIDAVQTFAAVKDMLGMASCLESLGLLCATAPAGDDAAAAAAADAAASGQRQLAAQYFAASVRDTMMRPRAYFHSTELRQHAPGRCRSGGTRGVATRWTRSLSKCARSTARSGRAPRRR